MPGLRMRATAWRASQDPQADTAVVTLLEADVLEPLQAVHWERSRKTGRGWEGTLGTLSQAHHYFVSEWTPVWERTWNQVTQWCAVRVLGALGNPVSLIWGGG